MSTPKPKRKAVPAAVARAVWMRDRGRCQWKLHDGAVCGRQWRVQLDHILPVARGGETTVEQCRLLCGVHNLEAARRTLGEKVANGWQRERDEARLSSASRNGGATKERTGSG